MSSLFVCSLLSLYAPQVADLETLAGHYIPQCDCAFSFRKPFKRNPRSRLTSTWLWFICRQSLSKRCATSKETLGACIINCTPYLDPYPRQQRLTLPPIPNVRSEPASLVLYPMKATVSITDKLCSPHRSEQQQVCLSPNLPPAPT